MNIRGGDTDAGEQNAVLAGMGPEGDKTKCERSSRHGSVPYGYSVSQ
jgi:hypothetical protein